LKPEQAVRKLASPGGADAGDIARFELANRVFFRLYQCGNLLNKTATRAVEDDGLTAQQWAVLGALSRPGYADGMGVGDLAKYLKVSRQNLTVLLGRMVRSGNIAINTNAANRRARLVAITPAGARLWTQQVLPKIHGYYESVIGDFSVSDLSHTLHYLLKLLDNMQAVDQVTAKDRAA
jgi:DNA-binding MarR family transcriptional regulator